MARLVEMSIDGNGVWSANVVPMFIDPTIGALGLQLLMHRLRYIAFFVLQFVLCLIWKRLPVLLVKKSVFIMCLQHKQSDLPLQGLHLPLFTSRFLTTFPLLILVCPMRSRKFWFLL